MTTALVVVEVVVVTTAFVTIALALDKLVIIGEFEIAFGAVEVVKFNGTTATIASVATEAVVMACEFAVLVVVEDNGMDVTIALVVVETVVGCAEDVVTGAAGFPTLLEFIGSRLLVINSEYVTELVVVVVVVVDLSLALVVVMADIWGVVAN